jgi:transposase-like protein
MIRMAVMIRVRFPPSLRNVEDLLPERGIDISHETVRYWWNRFGPRMHGLPVSTAQLLVFGRHTLRVRDKRACS